MRKSLAVLILIAPAGCNEGSTPPDVATAREEIRDIIKKYHELLGKGEPEAAVELAAADFSIVSSGENPVYGKEASLNLLKTFIDIYKEKDLLGKRDPRYGDIRIEVRGTFAIATYSVTFLEPTGPFNESYTHLFTRDSSKWVITHEHRSRRLPAK